MKFGHVTGTRKQRKPAQPWWTDEEERAIQAVEAAWQATHQPTQEYNMIRTRTDRTTADTIADFITEAQAQGQRVYRNSEITNEVETAFWRTAHERAVAQFGAPDLRLAALWIGE